MARAAYPALDGLGAELYGGRWNSRGRAVVYSASSPALAVLETLVHVDPDDVPDDLRLMAIDLADGLSAERVALDALPEGWQAGLGHPACRAIGDDWIERGATPLLVVPSAIVPEAENVLLNPRHPALAGIAVAESRPFSFDLRLL